MKNKSKPNYLDKIPKTKDEIGCTTDENGVVTLLITNKGFFNFLAQKLLKKPRISYIHLDEFGSFVWLQIDGKRDLTEIGKIIKEHFKDKAEPLYERLAKFFKILDSYGFIDWVK